MGQQLDVTGVEVRPNYALLLTFENGEIRMFDMTPYMDLKPYLRLKGTALFNLAKVDYGTVVWPGEIDIAPETLYDESVPYSSSEQYPLPGQLAQTLFYEKDIVSTDADDKRNASK